METEIDVENRDGTLSDGMYAEREDLLKQQNEALTFRFKPWSEAVQVVRF